MVINYTSLPYSMKKRIKFHRKADEKCVTFVKKVKGKWELRVIYYPEEHPMYAELSNDIINDGFQMVIGGSR